MSTAWSFSSLSLFEQCPYRYYVQRITKEVQDKPHEANQWGTWVHKQFENRLKDGTPLPNTLAKFTPMLDKFASINGDKMIEQRVALTAALKPTTYFAKDVWFRCQIDYGAVNGNTAILVDWKAGKMKQDLEQLRLSSAAVLAAWPEVNVVSSSFCWLKDNVMSRPVVMERGEDIKVWQEYAGRVHRIELAVEHNVWPKRPSGLCREYCPVGRKRCEHCGQN